jgi:hypothetical protein
MDEKKQKLLNQQKKLTLEVVRQMFTLATSGFGLVMALAWNSVIQEFVNNYVKKFFPNGGLLSLFLYAVVVTIVAVAVTLQLSKIMDRIEMKSE